MFLDIHAIQSVPPSNLNRDDNGSPKSAFYGGVPRHRVSSQAWKKSIRDYYNDHFAGNNRGYRTKNVVPLLADRIQQLDPVTYSNYDDAVEKATEVFINLKIITKAKKDGDYATADALYLVSNKQLDAYAELAVSDGDIKALKAASKIDNSLDLALFGRMVASATDLNIEGASQFAHAISTHAIEPEFDYFVAADDASNGDHAGAAMIGEIEFTSSTLYRFATVNVDALRGQFGNGDKEAVVSALRDFIESFVKALPSGKQSSFAVKTVPEFLMVSIRDDQPLSLVKAFESPVRAGEAGYSGRSVDSLLKFYQRVVSVYGDGNAANFGYDLDDNPKLREIAAVGDLEFVKNEAARVSSERLGD